MLLSKMLYRLRDARKERACPPPVSPEPLDHPSLCAMSLRELADLPIDPPTRAPHRYPEQKVERRENPYAEHLAKEEQNE